VAVDMPCQKCGYNLRGVRQDASCPECGTPVRTTLEGIAVADGRREMAAEALRSYGRSYLLSAPLGLALGSCIGAPVALVGLVGSFQRLMALRSAEESIPPEAGRDTLEFRRARWVAKLELGTGAAALPMLAFGVSWLTGPTIDQALRLAIGGGWLGIMALGIIAGSMLVDGAFARMAVDVERPRLLRPLLFGGIGAILAGEILGGFGIAVLPIVLWLGGTAAWAVACGMLAFHGSAVADEVAAPPLKRKLAAPVEEATQQAAPRVDPRARRAAKRALEDDSPIPLD
jgi:hypothetical protein